MMKNILCLLVMIVHSLNAFGGYSDEELNKLQPGKLFNNNLKKAIQQISSKDHVPLSYRSARRLLFKRLHNVETEDGAFVQDVYCQQLFRQSSNNLSVEHTWPKSLGSSGKKGETQRSDLHHLFPANSYANSERGNKPFAVVEEDAGSIQDCDFSLVGETSGPDNIEVFEPPHAHKGNVARAMFYFATRYKFSIDRYQEETFREWTISDPVDEEERLRNSRIEDAQGNRNPFIDFPYLVDQISNF